MKICLPLLLLIPFFTFAQVGVNTTTPRAALDVESTNNGVLIPRVQLTSVLDATTVINPNSGPLETSTLVYNIAPAGTAPNNVVAGFYYWNGSQWTAIAGNAPSDHDWYEVGTTVAPNAITDEMFHLGNVAIGKNTANHKLDVETTNQNVGISNALIKSLNLGVGYGIDNTLNINSNDETQAIRNRFLGTGTGLKTGLKNYADSSILGSKIGIDNELNSSGSNYLFGIRNTLNHSGSDLTLGLFNFINNPLGSTGTTHAIENRITNNSTLETTAIFNVIDSPDGGGGGSYGIHNFIGGRKTGGKYGFRNVISSLVQDDMYGVSNSITSTVDSGSIYGLHNDFNTNSNTPTYGNSNQLGGTGDGIIRGVYSFITNSGNGNHIGILSNLSGSGNGSKIGTYTYIDPTAGGTHYGIHSEVLKPGANNFAGYFLGNVGIGTTTTNTYTFPPSRGTNGQIMQTDGFGNLSWTNPLSTGNNWSIFGNSAIVTPANPATYGTSLIGATENFIGTTNAQAFVVGTNNIERMRVLPTGNVGIGMATSPAKLSVFGGFLSPTFPNTTTNAMLRIGNNTEGLDIGKAGAAGNYSAWLQSGFSGSADPLSLQPLGGNVGIGTTNPTSNLEIESGGVTELKLSSRAAFGATRFSMYSDKTLANEWRPAYVESADNGSFTGRLDFYTNGTGAANRLGSVRAMSITNGNVGIATTNPSLAKLQIEGMIGNTTAIFKGSATSQGISMVADWPGIYFNSYYNGGIRAMAGSGFPSIINTDQSNGNIFFQTTNVANTTPDAIIPSMPVRMTIAGNGNVGIGTENPAARLHIRRAMTFPAIPNTTSNAWLRIGDHTGGLDFGNAHDPDNYQWIQSGYSGVAYDLSLQPLGGNVGIGTNYPTRRLHIQNATAGALRIADGTQGANRVLTSDASGVATWRESSLSSVVGTAGFSGITIPTTQTSSFLNTGKTITLPPGRWVVNVTMLMSVYVNAATPPSPNNSSFWLRTCFADPTTLPTLTRTSDTVGAYYVSGNLPGTSMFTLMSGSIIINNTSGANRTYTYLAGEVLTYNTTTSLTSFTGWGEDSIVAYRLN